MAKGWQQVEETAQAQQESRERGDQMGKPQLRTSTVNPSHKSGLGKPFVVVRFCEQGNDVNSYNRHEYKKPDSRARDGFFRDHFTCLREAPYSQPECPGCKAGLPLKLKGAYNVIQRDRAVLRTDKDGKAMKDGSQNYIVEGHADAVVIFVVPSTTAEALRQKDSDYRGLMSRDVKLASSGVTYQPWIIEPADIDSGPQPMSDADNALAANKHDLDEFMKPPSFQEAAQLVARYGANSGAAQPSSPQPGNPIASPSGQAPPAAPGNVFLDNEAAAAAAPPTE